MTTPWMIAALGELGQAEIPGDADNPRVQAYYRATTLGGPLHDEVPWCSALVCWSFEPTIGLPRVPGVYSTRSALARSWLTWGQQLDVPRYGAVTIIARGNDATQGHAALFVDWDATRLWLCGGNQGDRVSVAAFDRARLLGFRWPTVAP